MKRHKYRFIKLVGSGYEIKFVKGKPVKKDSISYLQTGFLRKKLLPFKSEMHDYTENGEIMPSNIGEGLHIDVPMEVLVWNEMMKRWAISEHTKPSWFTEWKPLIFTFSFAVIVFIGMLWTGSKLDAVVNSSQVWMNKMDVLMGVI